MRSTVGRPIALQDRWDRGGLSTWNEYTNSDLVALNTLNPSANPTTHATTPHTKGAWVEWIASTSEHVDGLLIRPHDTYTSTADSSTLLDIGIGASGSEVVVVPNIQWGWGDLSDQGSSAPSCPLPVNIPRGSRIAARVQGAETTEIKRANLTAFLRSSDGRRSPASLDSIGVSTADSGVTTLTAPGASNTKSAYTEIVASTAQPYRAVVLCFAYPAGTTNAVSTRTILMDLAIGASGSEVPIIENMFNSSSTSEITFGRRWQYVHRHIPAGTRLAARYQIFSTTSVPVGAHVIGVPY